MLCGEFVNIIEIDKKNSNAFSVFYLYKNRKIMLEIIQHFLLQNYKTILHIYIYTSIFGTLGVTVFIQDTFLFMHPFIYTHTRTHYIDAHEKSHSDCSQSLIKNHPNRLLCCLLRSFCLLFLCISKLRTTYLSFKLSLPALPEIRCHLSMECK